jgi:hypothetical protein
MTEKKLKSQITDLCSEYNKAKQIYDTSGLNAELKESALQSMANILQLQSIAIANYANFCTAENACKTCKS